MIFFPEAWQERSYKIQRLIALFSGEELGREINFPFYSTQILTLVTRSLKARRPWFKGISWCLEWEKQLWGVCWPPFWWPPPSDRCPPSQVSWYSSDSNRGVDCQQRGLIYTERKSSGHHYLGVTNTTMSTAVQTLAQVKARINIMAVVVYSCCWSYHFISKLEYSWVEYNIYTVICILQEEAYWPRL